MAISIPIHLLSPPSNPLDFLYSTHSTPRNTSCTNTIFTSFPQNIYDIPQNVHGIHPNI